MMCTFGCALVDFGWRKAGNGAQNDDKKEIKERALKLMIMITITTQTLSPSPCLSPMCEFDSLSLPG